MAPQTIVAACLLFALPSIAADDTGEKAHPPGKSPSSGVVDPKGTIFGVPFGASGDEVLQQFGEPNGRLRLDERRTAFLYDRSFLFLFYEGKLDALRVSRYVINWETANWIQPRPPFSSDEWSLSNGIRSGMTLQQVADLLQIPVPENNKYRLVWSTDRTTLDMNFTYRSDRSEADPASYTLNGFLLTRNHPEGNRWTASQNVQTATRRSLKGKMMIGLAATSTKRGIGATLIYKGSPADLAGIKPGDLITSIDRQSTLDMTAEEFTKRISEKDPHELVVQSKEGEPRTVSVSKADGSTFSDTIEGSSSSTFLEVSVGQEAPDFEATARDGRKIKLSELRGRPVLINFTATWCQPCQVEYPLLVSTYEKLKDQGFEIISVYLDHPDKDVFAHARKLGATWPIHSDGKGWQNTVARTYGITGVPTNILVGLDGKIFATEAPGSMVQGIVESALKTTPPKLSN